MKANNFVPDKDYTEVLTGHVQDHFISESAFNQQYYNFHRSGTAADPDSNILKFKNFSTKKIFETHNPNCITSNSKNDEKIRKKLKAKRVKNDDPESEDFKGPWAGYEGEGLFDTVNQKPRQIVLEEIAETEAQVRAEKLKEREPEVDPFNLPEKKIEIQEPDFEPSSKMHIKEKYDYQGRSFIESTNSGTKLRDLSKSYLPKNLLHVYKGHQKGVQCVKFYPRFGTFLLTGSFDGTAKLWSVYNKRRLVQTYKGHTSALRDISFAPDGLTFISGGFDSRIQLWDTETGQVIRTFAVQKHPYCLKFNPDEDRQHSFLNASMNHNIEQYDVRTGRRNVVYQDHLGPVNSVVFCDNNKRFVSTGDDKKIYLWEFGVPVVIKHIADPKVNAVTRTFLHPNQRCFLGQTQNNQVLVFDTRDSGLRLLKNKKFQGHLSAGFSVGITASTGNGSFIVSGDQKGRLFFWDWKKCTNLCTLEAHEKVTIDVAWSPNERGLLATCSWDSTVRLWGSQR